MCIILVSFALVQQSAFPLTDGALANKFRLMPACVLPGLRPAASFQI